MRKIKSKSRLFLPDPKFRDVLVSRFINQIMKNGKKNLAYKIFYKALDQVELYAKNSKKNVLDFFKESLSNIAPNVEVRSRRIGGATFQIPVIVAQERKLSLAMKWLISFARKRNEKGISNKLAYEIIAAYKEEGEAVKKRLSIHKMAESNKAFSHFRF